MKEKKKDISKEWDRIIEECKMKDKERLLLKVEILEELIIKAMKKEEA